MKSPLSPAALKSSAAAILSAVCICFMLCALCHTPCTAGVTTRVSVSSEGTEALAVGCYSPSISGDGRFVAFGTFGDLVPGDTNGDQDIFVHDRQTGVTERVSVSSDGAQADGPSGGCSISGNGRYVAFMSLASNLVPDDTNGYWYNGEWHPIADIFVRDRETGVTDRVSISSDGAQGNADSSRPVISADGRFVAFQSYASSLVPGDTDGTLDIFVHDRQNGTTQRVSLSSAGEPADSNCYVCSISADGRYVLFHSFASNLVPDDTNGWMDVFVRDLQAGVTERISISSDGTEGNGSSWNASISADGRFVAFISLASSLAAGDVLGTYDIFVRDRQSGSTERLSALAVADGMPSISTDGMTIAYTGYSPDMKFDGSMPVYTSVFVYDRQSGNAEMVSVASDGRRCARESREPTISADGRCVAFVSDDHTLVAGDEFGGDVLVRDRWGIGNTKALPDAEPAVVSAGTVTAAFPGYFYAQDADRSSGIKVSWPGEVTAGGRYRVDGYLDTDADGERYINAWNVRRVDVLPVAPIGIRGNLLGGGSLGYDPITKAGQQGIEGAFGLNNIGLLIRTWGKVTQVGDGYLYVDDGSNLRDGTFTGAEENVGVRVVCNPTGYVPGDRVEVTGISSCFQVGNGTLARRVLTTGPEGIRKITTQ